MQGSVRPCRDKSPMEDRLITRLFAVLAVKYAHKWTSQFPDETMLEATKREWSKELGVYTGDHIAYAVDICADHHPEWPPTIGEFKLLCKAAVPEPTNDQPRLANPTKPETALKALSAIKELLK